MTSSQVLLFEIFIFLLFRWALVVHYRLKAVKSWFNKATIFITLVTKYPKTPDVDVGASSDLLVFHERFKKLPSEFSMFALITCWSYKKLTGTYEGDLDILLVALTYKYVDNEKLPPMPSEVAGVM